MTEQELVAQLKEGYPPAYEELVKQFGDKVLNTALGILQNAEDAEDVTQEVFTAVFQSIKQFNEEAGLYTWIYRITLSKSLELLRKRKAKKRFAFITSIFGKEATLQKADNAPFYHPGIQLENKERSATLFKAIGQLPENQRSAFVLHKVEGLSYAEIAAIMKMSVSSVESLMVRARQNLQKLLADYYDKNER